METVLDPLTCFFLKDLMGEDNLCLTFTNFLERIKLAKSLGLTLAKLQQVIDANGKGETKKNWRAEFPRLSTNHCDKGFYRQRNEKLGATIAAMQKGDDDGDGFLPRLLQRWLAIPLWCMASLRLVFGSLRRGKPDGKSLIFVPEIAYAKIFSRTLLRYSILSNYSLLLVGSTFCMGLLQAELSSKGTNEPIDALDRPVTQPPGAKGCGIQTVVREFLSEQTLRQRHLVYSYYCLPSAFFYSTPYHVQHRVLQERN